MVPLDGIEQEVIAHVDGCHVTPPAGLPWPAGVKSSYTLRARLTHRSVRHMVGVVQP
jgi:hypothetical protein